MLQAASGLYACKLGSTSIILVRALPRLARDIVCGMASVTLPSSPSSMPTLCSPVGSTTSHFVMATGRIRDTRQLTRSLRCIAFIKGIFITRLGATIPLCGRVGQIESSYPNSSVARVCIPGSKAAGWLVGLDYRDPMRKEACAAAGGRRC